MFSKFLAFSLLYLLDLRISESFVSIDIFCSNNNDSLSSCETVRFLFGANLLKVWPRDLICSMYSGFSRAVYIDEAFSMIRLLFDPMISSYLVFSSSCFTFIKFSYFFLLIYL